MEQQETNDIRIQKPIWKHLGFACNAELYNEVKNHAKEKGTNVNLLLRELVIKYMKEQNGR